MEVQSIVFKGRKLGFVSNSWSGLHTIEAFVLKFSDDEKRKTLLEDQNRIRFINNHGDVIAYEVGMKSYQRQERKYLEACLSEAVAMGLTDISFT